ncbi:uncharacterized protein MELLADRAFT_65706 [Melampsora larici-populina 98AG31]|uniref:IPT/TIG domain-containing protein n=1 Tax=Melampsora larici-populina (strain 98AG31 / pathotype 3-4-7) TaxID=747676 RepID=F4RWF1_MELLP|nr:uncharacterized protein MELLADRAFT_65706 [Melampsora larici-populina 98AG31]EGG03274.1 hypothetical protein MELLADRAFT_65706 [Melampsora larici-populina 98AG31]
MASSTSSGSSTPIQLEFSHLVFEEECAPATTDHQSSFSNSTSNQLFSNFNESNINNLSNFQTRSIEPQQQQLLQQLPHLISPIEQYHQHSLHHHQPIEGLIQRPQDHHLSPTFDYLFSNRFESILNDQFPKQLFSNDHQIENISSNLIPTSDLSTSASTSSHESFYPYLNTHQSHQHNNTIESHDHVNVSEPPPSQQQYSLANSFAPLTFSSPKTPITSIPFSNSSDQALVLSKTPDQHDLHHQNIIHSHQNPNQNHNLSQFDPLLPATSELSQPNPIQFDNKNHSHQSNVPAADSNSHEPNPNKKNSKNASSASSSSSYNSYTIPPPCEIESLIPFVRRLPSCLAPNSSSPPFDLEDQNISLLILGLPDQGAKTRVETQIKLTLVLVVGQPPPRAPDGNLSLDVQNTQNQQLARISNWSHVKLPAYSAIKRKSKKLLKTGIPAQETLFLEFSVTRATEPHTEILCCPNCQIREQKRTQRKRDARVRPAQEIESDEAEAEGPDDEAKKIVVFNCGQYLDFNTGQLTLPTRITCYCRHHREKKGFCVKITLRDHLDRIVAESITPPIMITDDHKAVAAAAKAKSGSDLETSQPRQRQIRKLPSLSATKSTGKRLKKKTSDPFASLPHTLDLDQAESPWSNLPDFRLAPDGSLLDLPAKGTNSKRKATHDIVNQRTPSGRLMTSNPIATRAPIVSHHNNSTQFENMPLPINPMLTDPSVTRPLYTNANLGLHPVSNGDDRIVDDSSESCSFLISPSQTSSYQCQPHLQAPSRVSNLSRRRSLLKLPQVHRDTKLQEPSSLTEHIDRSLSQPTRSLNETQHQSALTAALKSLMPPGFEDKRLSGPTDFALFSSCNNSNTDLTASSSSSPDRMFARSFESRTNTPPPSRSSGTSPGPSSGPTPLCRSGRNSPINMTIPSHSMSFDSASLKAPVLNTIDQSRETSYPSNNTQPGQLPAPSPSIHSPIGMLGNVLSHWNGLSTFFPTSASTQPHQSQLSQATQRSSSNEINQTRNNINPILSQPDITSLDSNISSDLPRPKIQKLVPNEGPLHGGIEITILGSGFERDQAVEFGSTIIQTQYWSSDTLICILPPGTQAGPVSVKALGEERHRESGGERGDQVLFRYVEDTNMELMELALEIIGMKMSQEMKENAKKEEDVLLKLLKDGRDQTKERIKMDERNRSGQNLLHLAVWLKMKGLVEFLVSDPEYRKKLVEARDLNGCTPLHFAAWRSVGKEIVKVLLEAGSRTYVRAGGMEDMTGLEILKKKGTVVEGLKKEKNERKEEESSDEEEEEEEGTVEEKVKERSEIVKQQSIGDWKMIGPINEAELELDLMQHHHQLVDPDRISNLSGSKKLRWFKSLSGLMFIQARQNDEDVFSHVVVKTSRLGWMDDWVGKKWGKGNGFFRLKKKLKGWKVLKVLNKLMLGS